jgi:hypothetical protein
MKLWTYEIKFKRFVDGVWDGKFRKVSISAENEFQAVYQHGVNVGIAYPAENIEDIIVMVNGGQSKYFEEGWTYETLSGDNVKMVKFKDLEGVSRTRTGYETIMDENGVHRYSRRDRGRCTGSHTNYPGNIQLGCFWQRMDIDDPYDYVMERKHKVYTEEEIYNGEDQ